MLRGVAEMGLLPRSIMRVQDSKGCHAIGLTTAKHLEKRGVSSKATALRRESGPQEVRAPRDQKYFIGEGKAVQGSDWWIMRHKGGYQAGQERHKDLSSEAGERGLVSQDKNRLADHGGCVLIVARRAIGASLFPNKSASREEVDGPVCIMHVSRLAQNKP